MKLSFRVHKLNLQIVLQISIQVWFTLFKVLWVHRWSRMKLYLVLISVWNVEFTQKRLLFIIHLHISDAIIIHNYQWALQVIQSFDYPFLNLGDFIKLFLFVLLLKGLRNRRVVQQVISQHYIKLIILMLKKNLQVVCRFSQSKFVKQIKEKNRK